MSNLTVLQGPSAAIAREVPPDWYLVGAETDAQVEARVAREREHAIRCGDVRREMFHDKPKFIFRWRWPNVPR